MTLFMICAALAIVGALYIVLGQLLRGRDPKAGEIRRLRGQMESLARAHQDGHIDKGAYQSRRKALTAELAEVMEQPGPRSDRSPLLALSLAIAIPAATIAIYLIVGEPRALDPVARSAPTVAGTPAQGESAAAPELASAIASLKARLEENPEDVDGWVLLGQSYTATDAYAEARNAFERALALAPEEPFIMELLGQAIALSSPPDQVPEEARQWFGEALERNPRSQRALFYMGFAEAQEGHLEEAMDYWQRLYAQLDPNDANARALREQMDGLAQRLGMPVQSSEASVSQDTPVSAGRTITVSVDVAEELWDQIEIDDVLFVFARPASGPRMPLAIARLTAGQLPTTVTLDESMSMSPAMSLASFDEVVVGARISKTGNATPQPGDMEALSEPVPSAGSQVDLVIAKVL